VPYAWDREVRALERALRPDELERVLGKTAASLYGVEL